MSQTARALGVTIASLALFGATPGYAQTPDEVLCDQTWPDAPRRAACKACGDQVRDRACWCRYAPDFCAPPPSAKSTLGVAVRFAGRPVKSAKVTVTSAGTTGTKGSDASGDALFEVTAKAVIKDVVVGPDAQVPGGTLPKVMSAIKVTLDREVTFNGNDTNKRVTIDLPVATVFVTALYHDERTGAWTPTRARTMFSLGDQEIVRLETGATSRGLGSSPNKSSLMLLVPPDQVGRELRVRAIDLEHTGAQDMSTLRVPAAGKTAFLELRLGDLMTQLERARAKLRDMLEQAYGPALARDITMGVRFEIGDFPTASYDAGVMRVPASWSLTTPDTAETIFHEWGHRLASVLARDPDFDSQVGGRTSSAWAAAPTAQVAWDEARANFYSQLFAASLQYPGDKAYRESTATKAGASCAQCPGYLASALVMHYRQPGLYNNALEIARDVRAVHDEATRTLGHPPRTYAEFVRAKQSLIDRQTKDGKLSGSVALKMKKNLSETNAKLKL